MVLTPPRGRWSLPSRTSSPHRLTRVTTTVQSGLLFTPKWKPKLVYLQRLLDPHPSNNVLLLVSDRPFPSSSLSSSPWVLIPRETTPQDDLSRPPFASFPLQPSFVSKTMYSPVSYQRTIIRTRSFLPFSYHAFSPHSTSSIQEVIHPPGASATGPSSNRNPRRSVKQMSGSSPVDSPSSTSDYPSTLSLRILQEATRDLVMCRHRCSEPLNDLYHSRVGPRTSWS